MHTQSRQIVARAIPFVTVSLAGIVLAARVHAQCDVAQLQKLNASNGVINDSFGVAVAVDGNRAAVGSRNHATAGAGSGAAYAFIKTGGSWSPSAVLTASDAAAGDLFGHAVGVSGSRTAVAAIGDADHGANTGSAYVYFGSVEEAKLVASDGAAGDFFGASIAIHGYRVVVGASGDDDLGSNSGSVYIFEWTGSQWLQGAKLLASDGVASNRFGASVAIRGDYVIVGAPETNQGASQAGSAYVFEWDGSGAWVQRAKLLASDPGAGDNLGRVVDIDSERAIVGAPFDALSGSGDDGSAYVFTRSGTSWTQTAKLVAADTVANRNFGRAVSLYGTRVLVGAHLDGAIGAGAAYLFESSTTGTWQQRSKILPIDLAPTDNFGSALALSGETALISSIGDDDLGSSSGSAYVFDASLAWSQRQKVHSSSYAYGEQVGASVALANDRAVVGAIGADDLGIDAGAAYALAFNGSSWVESAKLLASDGVAGDQFGASVAEAGARIAVGAPLDDSYVGANLKVNAGAVYVFSDVSSTWTQVIKLTASDADAGRHFGSSVSLSSAWLVVGSDSYSAAYVFDPVAWFQSAKLIPSGGGINAHFGHSVATCGNEIVVGAPNDSPGRAYVYRWNGIAWSQSAVLLPLANETSFGSAVAFSGDRILVGSPGSNIAHVFESSSGNWVESATLSASPATYSLFGNAVALWGKRALIGAPNSSWVPGQAWEGAAYVFELTGTQWMQRSELHGEYDGYNAWEDNVGAAVAISGDRILCGSPAASATSLYAIGAGYFFEADCPRDWVSNYCTAATTSSGCTAHITLVGDPSASTSQFGLQTTGVEGQKSGLIFYGVSGAIAVPWGPTGYLCVASPTQRLPAQTSQGTAGACDGSIGGGANIPPGALGTPFCPGQSINAQCWFRDPPSAKTTNMSDAIEFVLLP